MKTTTKQARALWIAIHLVCATIATTSPANQGTERRAAAPVFVVEDQRPLVERHATQQPAAKAETRLRRIRGHEMNVHLVKKAGEIIREHHKEGIRNRYPLRIGRTALRLAASSGTTTRPGGELRPWGHHPGCSLFAVETVN